VNLNRTFVISSNVFREVIRDRVLYLIGFFALAMAACIGLLPKVAAGTEHKLMLDVGLATMNLLGVVIAVFVGTTLVNKELEKRTVYVMMAKPISRIEFILGKHLGLSAVLAVLVTAMTSLFLAALINQQVAFSLPSILLTALFQFLELSLVTAIAILFGVFTSSLLATLFTFGIYLMGHLSREIVAFGTLAKSPAIASVTQGLYLLLPDLSRLNLKNQAAYGMDLLPTPDVLLINAGYSVLYIAVVLAIATLVFSRKQF
jgi:ABC-type transport system involved in multi-copper enzyme maturation permease subunit